MGDFQALQILGRVLQRSLLALDQVVEEVVVGEDGAEELAVIVAGLRADRFSVEKDLAGLRAIEAEQQLDQGRLAAAVLADDEDDVTLGDTQIDRAQMERFAAFDGGGL